MKKIRGVTLLELLIAIAVIAVLAALVMPALHAGRDRALDAKCLNHLRQVGATLFAYAAEHQQTIPTAYNSNEAGAPARSWATRLVYGGYAPNPDIFFCPSFFPRSNAEARFKPSEYNAQGPQTYGMRTWVSPGQPWTTAEVENGNRKLSTIETPADFFLVADSVWTSPNWRSQGYSISPAASEGSQYVHLRHRKMANALFADGHAAPQPADYFKALSNADRQRAYTGGVIRDIYTIEKAPF